MREDLHLTGLRYNIAAALFYVRGPGVSTFRADTFSTYIQIPYCLVEVPSYISSLERLVFTSETLFAGTFYSGCLVHLGGVLNCLV